MDWLLLVKENGVKDDANILKQIGELLVVFKEMETAGEWVRIGFL